MAFWTLFIYLFIKHPNLLKYVSVNEEMNVFYS